jgi:Spy/CpxP family protein refolding chaperone
MKILLSVLLSVAMAGVALAQQNGANAQNGVAAMGERFFPQLGRVLTDEQRQSFRQIVTAQFGQMRPLEQQLRSSRQALLNQITGGQFDENLVRQYAEQSAKAEAELTVMFAKDLSQMQPPLSAQQVKQLGNFQPQRFKNIPDDTGGAPPPSHMKLPPELPRDTNDLPVVQ